MQHDVVLSLIKCLGTKDGQTLNELYYDDKVQTFGHALPSFVPDH